MEKVNKKLKIKKYCKSIRGRIKDMVGTFVVKVYLLFIFNFLGAFPLNKKSYLNNNKKIQF